MEEKDIQSIEKKSNWIKYEYNNTPSGRYFEILGTNVCNNLPFYLFILFLIDLKKKNIAMVDE